MCRRQSWGKLPYGLVDQRHGRWGRAWFRGTPHLTCGTALLLATLTVSFLGMPLPRPHSRRGKALGLGGFPTSRVRNSSLFWERLRELGYVEGPDLQVERRYAGSPERLPTAAQELARLELDVIVARSATAAWHVRQATTTTPIVTVGDALVQARLVASLAHPGGTITGVDTAAPDLVAKRLYPLLKEADCSRIARVAGLRCPGGSTPAGVYFDAEWRQAETAAGVLGLTLTPVVVASSDQVAGALASIPRMHADGVFTFDCRYLHYRDAVLSSLPGMYYRPEHVEAGALMSYGWDHPRGVPPARRGREQDPQGGQAGRPAGAATHEVHAARESHNGQGPGLDNSPVGAHPGRADPVITRRGFLMVMTGFGIPRLAAAAQAPGKLPKVGLLSLGMSEADASRRVAFREGLRNLGWIEGQNILFESRVAPGHLDRKYASEELVPLATELVQQHVDVIVAFGTAPSQAARQATATTPIVMAAAENPVGLGLVASLARPAGNVTGVTLDVFGQDLNAKRLELLKETLPAVSRVAVSYTQSSNVPPGAAH